MSSAYPLPARPGLRAPVLLLAGLLALTQAPAATPAATSVASDPIAKARAAYARRDHSSLAALRKRTAGEANPLAMWVDYWDLSLRLRQASQAELNGFYARWPDTAVEDRLRKERIVWRGKHGDTAELARELPRVRGAGAFMSPIDREVECHALAQRNAAGEEVSGPALDLWFAQREADHGCAQLAATLYRAGRFTRDQVWERARLAAEQGRRYVVQHAIALLGTLRADQVTQAFLHPTHFLARPIANPSRDEAELTALAFIRLASRSASGAAAALDDGRMTPMPAHLAAAAWAVVAKEGAIGQRPQAFEWYQRAASVSGSKRVAATADTLVWQVRTALRAQGSVGPSQRTRQSWQMIIDAVDVMGSDQRADPTWNYWKARALQALVEPGASGDAQRLAARQLFQSIAPRLHYYGGLAAQELGAEPKLPKTPPPLTDTERAQARNHLGLNRGLAMLALNLRDEARAEWNHALTGMNDRALRAAAQLACDAQKWNLCMSTSELTRDEIDMAQRFPTPFREEVEAAAREADIDAARIYAVIRQESHFNVGARSIAGASGLMQLMPQTARWVARRHRISFRRERINDPATNVRLGAHYLKAMLDNFGSSHAHAAAAYNAGPTRLRRWSQRGTEDAGAWAEIIPINETRDYVKNVLANATSYRSLLGKSGATPNARAGEADGSRTLSQEAARVETH